MSVGNAVRRAACDAKRQILERVAQIFHCHPDNLDLKNSKVFLKARPEQAIPLIGVSMQAHFVNPEGRSWEKGHSFLKIRPTKKAA